MTRKSVIRIGGQTWHTEQLRNGASQSTGTSGLTERLDDTSTVDATTLTTRGRLAVMIDPAGLDAHSEELTKKDDIHALFNLEVSGTTIGNRILNFWRNLGSPVMATDSPCCQPAWFPWEAAGFSPAERTALTDVSPSPLTI